MSNGITVEKLMERMPGAFLPEKAEGVDAVIQFSLSGEGGGEWYADIGGGECKVESGTAESPNLTLMADAGDYVDIITGKLNAMTAFMEGKVKAKGDLNLAMKLIEFFKL